MSGASQPYICELSLSGDCAAVYMCGTKRTVLRCRTANADFNLFAGELFLSCGIKKKKNQTGRNLLGMG